MTRSCPVVGSYGGRDRSTRGYPERLAADLDAARRAERRDHVPGRRPLLLHPHRRSDRPGRAVDADPRRVPRGQRPGRAPAHRRVLRRAPAPGTKGTAAGRIAAGWLTSARIAAGVSAPGRCTPERSRTPPPAPARCRSTSRPASCSPTPPTRPLWNRLAASVVSVNTKLVRTGPSAPRGHRGRVRDRSGVHRPGAETPAAILAHVSHPAAVRPAGVPFVSGRRCSAKKRDDAPVRVPGAGLVVVGVDRQPGATRADQTVGRVRRMAGVGVGDHVVRHAEPRRGQPRAASGSRGWTGPAAVAADHRAGAGRPGPGR